MTGKIFGIGLQRTGTTSLYFALKELGINTAPNAIPLFYNQKDEILEQYDAFMDNPVPLIYQQIDKCIPKCKFILTTRSQELWLKSVQWLFEKELKTLNPKLQKVANDIHHSFYGSEQFNRDIFSSKWQVYHQEVLQYFMNRKEDLLVLDLESEFEWDPLCRFLDKKIPKKPFPHKNRAI
jgi:sulfotransferase family protein